MLASLQVSGVCEGMYEAGIGPQERARVIAEATQSAVQRAVKAGACAESCQVRTSGTEQLNRPLQLHVWIAEMRVVSPLRKRISLTDRSGAPAPTTWAHSICMGM